MRISIPSVAVVMLLTNCLAQGALQRDSVGILIGAIESALDDEDSDEDPSQTVRRLIEIHEEPVDLNSARERDLLGLPGITPLIAYRIVSARRERPFTNVAELLHVDGVTQENYESLLPFVTAVDKKRSLSTTSFRFRSRLQSEIERRRGYADGSFLGSPHRIFESAQGTFSREGVRLDGAVAAEKDAGERMSNGFIGGYCSVESGDAKILFGDYKIESGCGLVVGGRSRIGGRLPAGGSRPGRITGFRSGIEDGSLRGFAVEARVVGASVIGFYSNKAVSGAVNTDSVISGISSTETFRTTGDLEKRNASRERVIGGILSVDVAPGLELSMKGIQGKYMHRLALPAAGAPAGPAFVSAGVSLAFTAPGMSCWGELAKEGNGKGMTGGLEFDVADRGTLAFSAAKLGRNFSRIFGSLRAAVEEEAYQMAGHARLTRNLSIDGTWFLSSHPSGNDGTGFSGTDHSASVQVEGRIAPNARLSFRYKTRRIMEPGAVNHAQGILLTVQFDRKPFAWMVRTEYTRVAEDFGKAEQGILVAQEIRYRPENWLEARWKTTMFGTQSYDSRLYIHEPDVPGTVVNRAVFGRGSRSVLHVRLRPLDGLELSATYSREIKDSEDSLGSGPDELKGDSFGRYSFQVDLRF